jgi:hypothetical protein
MWNVGGPHDAEGRPAVQVCQVQGVEYHCFQSSKDPFTLSAWARVKLARLNEPAHAYFWPDRPLRLYRPVEPRGMLARLLARVAMSAVELQEADQFCEPVSRRVSQSGSGRACLHSVCLCTYIASPTDRPTDTDTTPPLPKRQK